MRNINGSLPYKFRGCAVRGTPEAIFGTCWTAKSSPILLFSTKSPTHIFFTILFGILRLTAPNLFAPMIILWIANKNRNIYRDRCRWYNYGHKAYDYHLWEWGETICYPPPPPSQMFTLWLRQHFARICKIVACLLITCALYTSISSCHHKP